METCFLLTPEILVEPEEIPLDILFEDDHLLVINKPAGMVVHPAPGHPSKTFVNALLYHCKQIKAEKDDLRPGIVHRLDKDTTGILVAAKTKQAHQGLISLFCERTIEKSYLAICCGNPGDRTVSAPIGRHPIDRKKMTVVSEGGKEAVTEITVLSHQGDYCKTHLKLLTGRTHQLRVHLKHIGFPLLGDPVYGSPSTNKKLQLNRQMLHAQELKFIHPILKKKLHLSAPLPQDMLEVLNKIGLA